MDWRSLLGITKLSKPEFVRDYESLLEIKIPNRKPLNELEFLVFDTETTGLNMKKDFVLSYGAVQVSNYRIKINTAKEFYLKPKRLNREAIKIHGLVKERPYISRQEMVREFVKDAANRILVGKHLGFDLAMMERLGKSEGLTRIKNPALDTHHLAIRLEMGKFYDPRTLVNEAFSLDKLCKKYQIELDDRHTAPGDAFLTAQLLLKLLKQAENKGIKTFGDLIG